MKIGFIGIGNMGSRMVSRLADKYGSIHVYDTDKTKISELGSKKFISCASPQEVGDNAELVFLSLPTGGIVLSVIEGESGLAKGKAVRVVVDLSTVGTMLSVQAHDALKQHDIVHVDSPVSGGIKGAADGTLAVMTACAGDTFATVKPYLDCLGHVFHVGEQAGQGQAMKLANNLLSMAALAITSEAVVMGLKAGLDESVMIDVLNSGSGRNSATVSKFPRSITPRTFDYGFKTGLAYKDIALCVSEAQHAGVPMVGGAIIQQLMLMTKVKYGDDSDFTNVFNVVAGLSA